MLAVWTVLIGTVVGLLCILTADLYQDVNAAEHKNQVQNRQIIDLMANQETMRQIFQEQLESAQANK